MRKGIGIPTVDCLALQRIAQKDQLGHFYARMKHLAIHSPRRFSRPHRVATAILGCAMTLSGASSLHAATVPAGCASIHHDGADNGAAFDHVVVTFPGNGGTLTATHETLSGAGESATGLADASSVLLLAALVGHHNAACSQWLENEGNAAEAALQAGHGLNVSWSNVSARHATLRIALATTSLAISRQGSDAGASLSMTGVTTSGVEAPSMIPQSAQAVFSLPADELAGLMASTAGKLAQLPAVHVTIHSLTAKRDTVELSGNGRATLTGQNSSASASGHMEIKDLSSLIDKARQDSQTKIAAALIIARLVSHKSSGSNTWDVNWEGGILTVNGVPLPLK